MKKNKIIIIIVVTVLILLGLVLGIYKAIDAIKKDSEKTAQQVDEIKEYYESLNTNAGVFNEKREAYDALMKNTFYSNLSKNNANILKSLNEYDEIIGKIKEDGNNLQEKCSIYYRDSETMQRCESYKITYESAMQVFISDVKRYNTLVENYNKWIKENPGYKEISTFKAKNVE